MVGFKRWVLCFKDQLWQTEVEEPMPKNILFGGFYNAIFTRRNLLV